MRSSGIIFSTQTQPCKLNGEWGIAEKSTCHSPKYQGSRERLAVIFLFQPKTLDTPWYATKYRFPLFPLLVDGATQKQPCSGSSIFCTKGSKIFKYLHNSKNCTWVSAMVFSQRFHSSEEILKNVFFVFSSSDTQTTNCQNFRLGGSEIWKRSILKFC